MNMSWLWIGMHTVSDWKERNSTTIKINTMIETEEGKGGLWTRHHQWNLMWYTRACGRKRKKNSIGNRQALARGVHKMIVLKWKKLIFVITLSHAKIHIILMKSLETQMRSNSSQHEREWTWLYMQWALISLSLPAQIITKNKYQINYCFPSWSLSAVKANSQEL